MARHLQPQTTSLYGEPQPLTNLNLIPVTIKRAPTALDTGWPIGQLWFDKVGKVEYVLTSVSGGTAVWEPLSTSTESGTQGTATLAGGTVTVNTTAVTATSLIFLSVNTPAGTQGTVSAPTASITAGTSFVINSSNALDTSTVNWMIVQSV